MSSRKVRKGKYIVLLEDSDVRRWYDNVVRGSPATADVYLRRLDSFCKHFDKTPKALATLSVSNTKHVNVAHSS